MEPLSGRNIRLLRLEPGQVTEPLVGRLDVSSLDSNVVYTALSYVWGTARATRTISLNDKEFRIRPNLDDALRRVRSCDNRITLWVDAICIDQTNDTEKAHQVGMMRDIFQLCTEAFMYLGEPLKLSRNTEKRHQADNLSPPELIEPGAFSHIGSLADTDALSHIRVRWGSEGTYDCNGIRGENFEQIRSMLQSPWWTRIWTVQEVCLPSAVTFIWGNEGLDWESINAAVSDYKRHSTGCCSHIKRSLPTAYRKVLDRFCEEVERISWHRSKDRTNSTPAEELLSLLRDFHKRRAHNEHDKVFALLGLVTSIPQSIEVNYTRSSADLFVDTTRSCIEATRSLNVLVLASGQKYHTSLPSWVPDFAVSDFQTSTMREEHYRLYDASQGAQHASPSGERELLRTQAVRLGALYGHDSSLYWDDYQSCRETIAAWSLYYMSTVLDFDIDSYPAWCQMINNFGSELPLPRGTLYWHDPPIEHVHHLSRMWRSYTSLGFWTLLCGELVWDPTCDGWKRAETSDLPKFYSWLIFSGLSMFSTVLVHLHSGLATLRRNWDKDHPFQKPPPMRILMRGTKYNCFAQALDLNSREFDSLCHHWWDLNPGHAQDFDRAILAATANRRLFAWEKSEVLNDPSEPSQLQYGVGPTQVRSGDTVAILAGGRCPFILRPCENSLSTFEEAGKKLRKEDSQSLNAQWTLVGPCVLPGLMHGEGWNKQELRPIDLV